MTIFRSEVEDESHGTENSNTEIHTDDLSVILSQAILQQAPISDIQCLIRKGANVNNKIKNGMQHLHYAVDINYTDCMQLLIENGANIDSVDDNGYTPLLLSASRGFFKALQILIDHGAIVNYCDAGKEDKISENLRQMGFLTYEPLNVAIENNNISCVKLLLESGASPNKKYYMGYEINLIPIHHLSCLELLLQYGADPNVFGRNGMTPLMKACKENNIDAVKILVQFGANVNLKNKLCSKHSTALSFAIGYGSLDIIELLLQNNAIITNQTDADYGPLHDAVLFDRLDVCRLLLSRGANVEELSGSGCTPLMLAANCPKLDERKAIIELLLQKGADPNFFSHCNITLSQNLSPLAEYLKHNKRLSDIGVIHLLIKYGARVNIREFRSCGAIDPYGILPYLSEFHQMDIMELLLSAAKHIDRCSILQNKQLQKQQNEYLLREAVSPRPLKNLVRLSLCERLGSNIPKQVTELPLPKILKRYLMFEL